MMKVAKLSVYHEYFKWKFIVGPDFNVENFIKNKERVHDADSCGDCISFWVVVTDGEPKFYRSEHSWYWHNYGQEDSELINEFDIAEVPKIGVLEEAKDNLRFVV